VLLPVLLLVSLPVSGVGPGLRDGSAICVSFVTRALVPDSKPL
jgi:hypothetical protein